MTTDSKLLWDELIGIYEAFEQIHITEISRLLSSEESKHLLCKSSILLRKAYLNFRECLKNLQIAGFPEVDFCVEDSFFNDLTHCFHVAFNLGALCSTSSGIFQIPEMLDLDSRCDEILGLSTEMWQMSNRLDGVRHFIEQRATGVPLDLF